MQQYLRPGLTSTPFCPGCGHGILMGLILRAIQGLGLNMDEMLFVSGIGCAAWIPSPHFNADTLHVLHGRAIPAATGAKAFNPELQVVVISGDGDLADIGGNHLIHAARRNLDMTVICASNMVYGMTGGQSSSTTSVGALTRTATRGNHYRPLDLCRLVVAAGATYAARYSVIQPFALMASIKKALQVNGFCFIEVLSPCPTQFGRHNELDTPVAMIRDLMDKCITKKKAGKLSPGELKGKIITGEFTNGGD
jgi:2-oxoglutarate ferredoxin oxidoreductase subunit beta